MYPNQQKASLLIKGFSEGFNLPPFEGLGCSLNNNLKSANEFHNVVREKLTKEVRAGRMEGPFESPPFLNFRVSPVGVVPKKEPNSAS